MSAYPLYPRRNIITLDGLWQFEYIESNVNLQALDVRNLAFSDFETVPGVFDINMERYGKRGVGVYCRKVKTTDSRLHRLHIGGIGLAGRFLWDGIDIGFSQLAYSTFDIDFYPGEPGEHELIIAVDNRFNPVATPIFARNFDFYGYGGIYRGIELYVLPEKRFERVKIKTINPDSGLVELVANACGFPDGINGITVAFDNNISQKYEFEFKDGCSVFQLNVPAPLLWSPATPNLHTIQLEAHNDIIVERFGLRTISVEGDKILLNGEVLYLQGVCRHESHPELGPVQNNQLMLTDIQLIKNLGANFIRCVHYPYDQAFLDMCDETGMLLWIESMGWNNTVESACNQAFIDLQVSQTKIMACNSMNNPSVIIRGFLNECCSNAEEARPLYKALCDTIRGIDHDFLVSYASNKINRNGQSVFDVCFDLVDVVAYNTYPGWISPVSWDVSPVDMIAPEIARLAAISNERDAIIGKPVIFSEIGVCAIYGCHDQGRAQWSEEFQAEYLNEACRNIFAEARFSGLSLWQFCDTRSYVNAASGARSKPRGFNCAGLLDEYRRPKLSYQLVKELFSKNLNRKK